MGAGVKAEDYEALRELFKPHIESFDHFIHPGMENVFLLIKPVQVFDPVSGKKLRIWVDKPELHSPVRDNSTRALRDKLLPSECRLAGLSYHGRFYAEVCLQWDGGAVIRARLKFGHIPIMLKSKLCHLRGADPQKLISLKEEATEMGGYFICSGMERLFRLLILSKRNYPIAVLRDSHRKKGYGFSNQGVIIRCVRDDQSAVMARLYYLQNGSARLGFKIRGREFLLPVGVALKAFIDTSDHEIYVSLCSCSKTYQRGKGAIGSPLVADRAVIILDEVRDLSLLTRRECVQHIGEFFRPVMNDMGMESNYAVGEAVLRDYIFVHLVNNHDKFNLLIFMLQKLFAIVDQTAVPDNSDALQHQEVLQPGLVIAVYLKAKVEEWLDRSRALILDAINNKGEKFDFCNVAHVRKVMEKANSTSIGKAIESMIKNGKINTISDIELPQRDSLTIPAERLNHLRFLSHFRSVHRGAYFTAMRTTTVRKLLPESWGFLCPVHTPDGTPCGLLNHMTTTCRITSFFDSLGNTKNFQKIHMSIVKVLTEMGMAPLLPRVERAGPPDVLHVLLDGCVIGSISSSQIETVAAHLRRLKITASSWIPDDLEVGYVPLTMGGAYPGLFLFTSPSRFVRPVRNISLPAEENGGVEFIGPFEQVYMEIKCADGGDGGRKSYFPATHEEIHPTGILSVVANLTPWSDHNQSPRNMYQCQMAKQTMGFSSQAIQFRADNKLYHLQTPQTPIVRTTTYSKFCMDEFPTGTNAIVAVLAYSGYDMEDAMILNKSSIERGMCHGQIYQAETVDLVDRRKADQGFQLFGRSSIDRSMNALIDSDGLPYVGQIINPGEPYYSVHNTVTNTTKPQLLKGTEPAVVDYVSIDGTTSRNFMQKVNIRLRRSRNPVIGDKFSSRHGQKGVCSQLWPDIDMPFSAVTGMRPDLIINPHAFPSRMTIGMLFESIAAKGGSLHGKFVDATPFANSVKEADGTSTTDSNSLVDELGPMLASYGFNYHGSEVMYSGVLGTELACEIFIGPVYYQRLRHMVSDKFQVRSTGTVDPVTKQPIKGRKFGGGIRFGEMERDSLLAHGAAYLLHDRLHTCSDYHIADVCSICGSILTTSIIQHQKRAAREIGGLPPGRAPKKVICHACKTSKGMETVAMPFIFRMLAAELAAMNVRVTLQLSNQAAE